MTQDEPEPFFVGYLPVPRALKRFGWAAAALTLALTSAVASLALFQRSPGETLEAPAWSHTVTGVLRYAPYATLAVPSEDGATVMHVILAGGGKFGPSGRLREDENEVVTLKGNLFRRDGRALLEVGRREEGGALTDDQHALLASVGHEDLGPVTRRGQIVDSKCYFGRMRPGEGRGHRACAQYCIAGGMAPVLVTHSETGEATHYLLTTEAGRPANEKVLPYVAEPVRVTGNLSEMADLLIIRVDEIERL